MLKLYQETLGITYNEANEIICKNATAKALIVEEPALSATGMNKTLSALLRATLLREFYDFEPLKESEKDLIKKYYK